MRKIDYREGRELEKTHVCKECGGGLVTAWGNFKGLAHHVIKCSENNAHEGEVRKGYLNYHEQPIEIKNAMDRKEQNGNRTNNTRGN